MKTYELGTPGQTEPPTEAHETAKYTQNTENHLNPPNGVVRSPSSVSLLSHSTGSEGASSASGSPRSHGKDEKKDFPSGDEVVEIPNGFDNSAYIASTKKFELPPNYDDIIPQKLAEEKEEGDEEEVDPWELVAPPSTGKPWSECSVAEKICRVIKIITQVLSIVLMLYLFICSLDILGAAFQLIGGRSAGAAFKSDLLQNPICGLAIGIAVTALLQSSSTSTSIIVTMVAANILSVEQGIYIIMGANIGTAFTSGLVALSQIAEKNQFRRAFASSMLLYIFNLLTVSVLLPLEYFTGYLNKLTLLCVDGIDIDTSNPDSPQFLKVITQPFTQFIIQVDKDVISAIAQETFSQKRPLTKYICAENSTEDIIINTDYPLGTNVTDEPYYMEVRDNKTHPTLWAYEESINDTEGGMTRFSYAIPDFDSENTQQCNHLFTGAGLSDEYEAPDGWPHIDISDELVGCVLLIISLVTLCGCLIGMVKVLTSLLKGSLLKAVRKSVNSNFPCGTFGEELAGYVSMLAGVFMTILVQSSSVFTAALNPLAGMGIVTIDRVYPLTVGSDIGTTITSILAAFTADPASIKNALQCAFAHFFFNVTGMLMWYVIPKIRQFPIYLSVSLGNITADYKWFAVIFLSMTYFILPLLILLLSIPGWYVLVGVMLPIFLAITIIVIINRMQTKCPSKLPSKIQTWNWCPIWCHSMEPYDSVIRKVCPCKMCNETVKETEGATSGGDVELEAVAMEVVNGDLVPKEQTVDNKNETENNLNNSNSINRSDSRTSSSLFTNEDETAHNS